MIYKRLSSTFILFLAVSVSWGCATTGSTSATQIEYGSQVTQKTIVSPDYANQRIDADISSAIKMKYATDELLSDSDISVDTEQRNVTLRGNLNTQAEVNRAIHLGRSVTGVRSVHSILTLKKTRITSS